MGGFSWIRPIAMGESLSREDWRILNICSEEGIAGPKRQSGYAVQPMAVSGVVMRRRVVDDRDEARQQRVRIHKRAGPQANNRNEEMLSAS
jgi:hypothetical protein